MIAWYVVQLQSDLSQQCVIRSSIFKCSCAGGIRDVSMMPDVGFSTAMRRQMSTDLHVRQAVWIGWRGRLRVRSSEERIEDMIKRRYRRLLTAATASVLAALLVPTCIALLNIPEKQVVAGKPASAVDSQGRPVVVLVVARFHTQSPFSQSWRESVYSGDTVYQGERRFGYPFHNMYYSFRIGPDYFATIQSGLAMRQLLPLTPRALPAGILLVPTLQNMVCYFGVSLLAIEAYCWQIVFRRRRTARCEACGYDTRQTAGLCPECGLLAR